MTRKKSSAPDQPDGDKIEVKSAPQVNDVAKPGSTAASPTSRPIITGHTGMIKKDPMMAREDKEAEDETKKEAKKSEIKIEPIAEDKKSPPVKGADSKEGKEETLEVEDTKAKDDTSEKSPENKPEDTSSDSAEIDSLATAAEEKKLSAKQEEAKKVRDEKIKELISSKKYNVSIVEGGHKATSQKIVTWILILLLLFAIVAYIAVDGGYLDIGINPPFDLISN